MNLDPIGIGDRLFKDPWKRLTKRTRAAKTKAKTKAGGSSTTRLPDRTRKTRMGRETVTLTPRMRKALPANQPQQRGESTAARPVRCSTCGGFYGALKSVPSRPRAHQDARTGRPCPGGGTTASGRKGRAPRGRAVPPDARQGGKAATRPAASQARPAQPTARQPQSLYFRTDLLTDS